jgi:hypothetical protein
MEKGLVLTPVKRIRTEVFTRLAPETAVAAAESSQTSRNGASFAVNSVTLDLANTLKHP